MWGKVHLLWVASEYSKEMQNMRKLSDEFSQLYLERAKLSQMCACQNVKGQIRVLRDLDEKNCISSLRKSDKLWRIK